MHIVGLFLMLPSLYLSAPPPLQARAKEMAAKKAMRNAWFKWTMEFHNFSNILLSAAEVGSLSGGARENLEISKENGTAMMPSLKYFFQQVPENGQVAKALTSDQKVQNVIFMRECRRAWGESKDMLKEQLKEGKSNNGFVPPKTFDFGDQGGGFQNLDLLAEAEAKRNADKGGDAKGGAAAAPAAKPADAPADGKKMDAGKLEQKVLNKLSLGRMREWIEEDEDRHILKKKKEDQEHQKEVKDRHEQFVRKKADDDRTKREEMRAKRNSAEVREAKEKAAAAKELSKEAFEKWVIQKEMREQSQRCLNLMPPPQLPKNCNAFTDEVTVKVIEVGRALKKIDRTLVQEWAKWCEDVMGFNTANILWDAFEPIACDVHSAAHSVLKETFSRLLTPGKDYKKFFMDFAKKQVRRSGGDVRDQEDVDKKFDSLSLKRPQMLNLLNEMGIIMKPNQVRTLVDAFDTNGDGEISCTEFLDFVDGGKTSCKCCWITTCNKTGMANAYSVSEPTKKQARAGESKGGNESKNQEDDYGEEKDDDAPSVAGGLTRIRELANGEKRIMVELQDRKRREDMLVRYGVVSTAFTKSKSGTHDDYDDDFDDAPAAKTGKAGDMCPFASWTNEQRKSGLRFLIDESRQLREEEALKKILSEGEAPRPPKFSVAKSYSQASSMELTMCWEPQPGDLVSFFCVESSGPTGQAKEGKYTEVFRDPPSADPSCSFGLTYTMRNLQPGTSYQFRIRGFNGFGPGDYTYRIFTTRTDAPPPPRILKLSSDSVTLRWSFSETFFVRMDELARMFKKMDVDNSGCVSRQELTAAVEDQADKSSVLRNFLIKKADSIGVDISQGCGALFDAIEGDDNGDLTWEEFETFFLAHGWADAGTGTGKSVGVSQSMRSSMGGGGRAASKQSDVTYVVERCENEFDGVYKECLKTTAGYGTISRLTPGMSYRFRVYSINAAGVAGPKSTDVVVHSMIETPSTPTPVTIGDRAVTLAWKARGHSSSMRDATTVNKLLNDWAGNHDGADGGVSIELAFAKYDANHNGDIDAKELGVMLADLGVDPTTERLAEAFHMLDVNGDGVISFEEFSEWWRRDDVTYTIKRSETLAAGTKSLRDSFDAKNSVDVRKSGGLKAIAEGGMTSKVGCPITVYRGSKTRYEVAGLEPNRLYHFRLRLMGSRCNSHLSNPVVLMTAPRAPGQPVLLDVGSTHARIKFYSPAGGAYKFAVQLRNMKARVTSATQDPTPGGNTGWITVFNGQETVWQSTTMVSDTNYEVRVLGLNYQGTMGQPSPALAFATLPRSDKVKGIARADHDTAFTIECSGDICVGDTLLITEQLFVKDSAKNATLEQASRSSAVSRGKDGTVRLDMSVTSMQGSVLLPPGAYIGDRTIAAIVVKDNYRTGRDGIAAKNLVPRNHKKFGRCRHVWLEVIWQRASSEACKPFELKSGEVIERSQSVLEEYEVYRKPWKDEAKRIRLDHEWPSLVDCYRTSDCDPLPTDAQ